MLARCVACFKKSTYLSAEHIVFDTSPYAGETIGYIRNIVNACAKGELIAWKTQIECLGEPRMICGIHGIPGIPGSGNTETYDRSVMSKETDVWRRSPEWDSYCARVMELK